MWEQLTGSPSRENRTPGSEGGDGLAVPYPYPSTLRRPSSNPKAAVQSDEYQSLRETRSALLTCTALDVIGKLG